MPKKSNRLLWAKKLAGKRLDPSTNIEHLAKRGQYKGSVLGIDPSLRGTGMALLSFDGKGGILLHKSQTLRLKKCLTLHECLGHISQAVTDTLKFTEVTHVAIEETIYVQNFQTAQILGAARGAAIAAAAVQGLPIFEYPPLRIKQAIVGFGRASKEQMAKTVMQHLGHTTPLPLDEADAAGVAICHSFTFKE